eukprot:Partr_v1_DN27841_c1_g1_i4_m22986 putative sarcolemma associated protein
METPAIVLIPENACFKTKKVAAVTQPVTLGRVLDGQDPNVNPPNWIRFQSKVVSRTHAKLSFADGKYFIQDTKSSSGTFVNGERLSLLGAESEPREIKDGDVVKLGEDYNQDGVLHLCVMFRVRLPGGKEDDDLLGDDATDTMDNDIKASVEASVDDEFNTIWNSLIADINIPLKKLRSGGLVGAAGQAGASNTTKTATGTSAMGSPSTTQTFTGRNDNTVTLIKFNTASSASIGTPSDSNHHADASGSSTPNGIAKAAVSQTTVSDCVAFIESLQWESTEMKDSLVEMVRRQDNQLLAFYKSLRGFPSSFMNVASKYAKMQNVQKK